MRKLIRSISPFSKKNVTVEDPGPSVPVTSDYRDPPPTTTTPKPTWSVEGINFLQFLQIFYERFNSEKLSSIDFIYQEYKGEEMVLIYELAEKYHLSQDEMQKILNLSKNSTLRIDTTTATKNGPPSSSTSNGSLQNEPQELHSVVAPNWQTKRPERTGHRNVSPYVPRPDTTEAKPSDKKEESQLASTPMSLQDIIQTTRQNDLLAKKSVRFSVTDPETVEEDSENNSSQSGVPTTLMSTRKVSSFAPSPQSKDPMTSSTSTLQSTFPTVNPSSNTRQNQGYPALQSQSGQASGLQARIRSSLIAQSAKESDSASSISISGQNGNSITQGNPRGDIHNFNSMNSNDSFGSGLSAKPTTRFETSEKAEIDASRIKVLEEELSNLKLRLKEAENEREDLLKMFEDSWSSPQQVLKVVHTYLAKYNRKVEIVEDEQNSVRSSLSSNLPSKLDDLEGRRTYRAERTLDVNQHIRSNQEKPYMLGTVSSVKRGMEVVLGADSTPSRDASPIPGRGRSPAPRLGGQNSGGRWIRPSSADRSQRSNRSSSPASSITDVSSRYRGYTPPSRDHSPAAIDSQYKKTKQQLQQETDQERQNHDLDRTKYEKNSKLFEKEKLRVSRQIKNNSPGRLNSNSPLKGNTGGSDIDDWVTCIDPKTQRKYYYSKSRKVSTWTLPESSHDPNKLTWSPSSGAARGQQSDSRSSTPNSSRPSSRERNYPQRAPSPTGSLTSTSSQNTRERSNSSSIPIGGGWFEAIDPQSGRTYWFNRTTRQSTWKRPTEIES